MSRHDRITHQDLYWQITRQHINSLNLLFRRRFPGKKRGASHCSLQLLSTSIAGSLRDSLLIAIATWRFNGKVFAAPLHMQAGLFVSRLIKECDWV